jgi:hypothetical protein
LIHTRCFDLAHGYVHCFHADHDRGHVSRFELVSLLFTPHRLINGFVQLNHCSFKGVVRQKE